MFCAGEFIDNQYTIEGTSLHERTHRRRHREETWQLRLFGSNLNVTRWQINQIESADSQVIQSSTSGKER